MHDDSLYMHILVPLPISKGLLKPFQHGCDRRQKCLPAKCRHQCLSKVTMWFLHSIRYTPDANTTMKSTLNHGGLHCEVLDDKTLACITIDTNKYCIWLTTSATQSIKHNTSQTPSRVHCHPAASSVIVMISHCTRYRLHSSTNCWEK